MALVIDYLGLFDLAIDPYVKANACRVGHAEK
jgi:hypothetical protein